MSLLAALLASRGAQPPTAAGRLYHQNGPNTHAPGDVSDGAVRVGLNIACTPHITTACTLAHPLLTPRRRADYPTWMNNWVEGGHQPLWPETYARMPPEVQRLMPGLHGRRREELYEWEQAQRPSL